MGALRLLANSHSPEWLNTNGFGLYAEFRPSVDGWGQRGEVRCETILKLRKPAVKSDSDAMKPDAVPSVKTDGEGVGNLARVSSKPDEPPSKRMKTERLDEYDLLLEDDRFLIKEDLIDDVP